MGADKRGKGSVRGMTVADFPELAAELLPELNDGARPEDFPAGGWRRPVWKCSRCGNTWDTSAVVSRAKNGTGCPECARARPLSLAQRSPELAAQWHPELNGCAADEVPVGNNQRMAWWVCAKGHPPWPALISVRYYVGSGCPKCGLSTPSDIEDRLRQRLNASRFGLRNPGNSDVAVKARWPNGRPYRVDFLGRVPQTGQPVVVEYDGRGWHEGDSREAVDAEKTRNLLGAGYVVVRVREGRLPHLPIEHPALMQLSHRWSNKDEDLAPLVDDITAWLDSLGRSRG